MPRDGHELQNWPELVPSPNRPNQGLNLANSGCPCEWVLEFDRVVEIFFQFWGVKVIVYGDFLGTIMSNWKSVKKCEKV